MFVFMCVFVNVCFSLYTYSDAYDLIILCEIKFFEKDLCLYLLLCDCVFVSL